MSLELTREPVTPVTLAEHARVPIAFVVDRILEVTPADGGMGGVLFAEAAVAAPYVKDYDAIKGEGPTRWAHCFDTSNWGLICGRQDGALAGGAVIAWRTPGLDMLAGRDDVAVLWDIRVAPAHRGAGAGSALFRAAESWAAARGCSWLKIETQNINIVACRFYRKMGCTLGAIDRFAYPELPDEVQLLWWKALEAEPSRSLAAPRMPVAST
jgi:ribosomal protein S18 acetylase RimI-like enzyme